MGVAAPTSVPVTTHTQTSSVTWSAPGVATTTSLTTSNTIRSTATTSYSTRSTTSVRRIKRSTTSNVASNPSATSNSASAVQAIASSSTAALSRRKRKRRQQSEDEREEGGEKCEAFICQAKGTELKTRSWIFCEKCNKWFHFDCVGIKKAPPGDYNCGCHKR